MYTENLELVRFKWWNYGKSFKKLHMQIYANNFRQTILKHCEWIECSTFHSDLNILFIIFDYFFEEQRANSISSTVNLKVFLLSMNMSAHQDQ